MRWLIALLLVLILSLALVTAAVKFPCETDSQCSVLAGETGICIDGECITSEKEEPATNPADAFKKSDAKIIVKTFRIEESELLEPYTCDGQGCLRLSPQKKESPFVTFFRWLVYA